MSLARYYFNWIFVKAAILLLLSSPSLSVPTQNSTLHEDGTSLGCIPEGASKVCFFLSNTTLKWDEAWASCQQDGRRLASLSSKAWDDKVKGSLKEYASNLDHESPGFKVWTSGHTTADRHWKWIDGQPINEKHTVFTIPTKDYQNCAAMESPEDDKDKNVRLTGRHCRSLLHFLCQQKLTGTNLKNGDECKIGTHTGVFIRDSCIVPYGNDPQNFRQTFYTATDSCASIKASLATMGDYTLDETMLALNIQPDVYWIGLTNLEWVWTEQIHNDLEKYMGAQMNYSQWYSNPSLLANKPTECLAAGYYQRNRYGWTDEPCSDQLPFICQQVYEPEYELTASNDVAHNGSEPVQHNELQDWANVIIPCAMVALIALAAVLSVVCHYHQKRKDYKVEK